MPKTPHNLCIWLLKTEPETYSFQDLARDKKTFWNGVRNYQARNFLKEARVGDLALIYHSGEERAVMGIARVTQTATPDPDPKKPGDWVQIQIAFHQTLVRPVGLDEIKKTPELRDFLLLKQSRLSVMPVTLEQYKTLIEIAQNPGKPKSHGHRKLR